MPAVVLSLALAVSLRAAPASQAAPPVSMWRDALRDLVARISTTLTRAEAFDLAIGAAPEPASPGADALQREVLSQLRARGLRPVARTDATSHVVVTCAENLRDRLCAAEVVRPGGRTLLVSTRPLQAPDAAEVGAALFSVSLRPVIAQRRPILDLAMLDERRLMVLDTAGLALFERKDEVWVPGEAHQVDPGKPWPQDPRGRLVVRGNDVEAFIPGRVCRGTVEPLAITCTEGQAPWPLGIENAGLADGRNFFTSARTAPFYSAASISPTGGAPWLLAGVDRRLTTLDAGSAVATVGGTADDLVRIGGACLAGRSAVLVAVDTGSERADGLRLHEFVDRQLVPMAPPLMLPGPLAALWPTADQAAALAVSRNLEAGRYEAFLVGVSCAR